MFTAARAALKSDTPLIVIGGGDGTINAMSHVFADSDKTLGILPLGTGNAFARDLGIQTSVEHACSVIVHGKTSPVDMGLANGRPFLNVATVGLSTLIAMGLRPGLKRMLGPMAYLMPAFNALRIVRPFEVHLQGPGVDDHFESMQVVIGNGRFHAGRLPLGPGAGLTTGELVVYGLASRNRAAFARLALNLWSGRHVDLDEVRYYRMTEGTLATTPSRSVTVDGERLLRTPIEFRVDSGALNVRVPLEFDSSEAST